MFALTLTVGQAKATTYWGRPAMKTKLLGLIASVALFGSLLVGPANAVTYYIDGVMSLAYAVTGNDLFGVVDLTTGVPPDSCI
jgi:hypothetical protein